MFRELLLIATVLGCSPETPHTVEWINPSDELRPYFEHALERWETAGMTPDVIKLTNAGGSPAYMVDYMPHGTHGETMREGGALQYVKIYRDTYEAIDVVVAHEICHLLGARRSHGIRHSEDGLCSSNLLTNVITEGSLLVACGPDSQYCDGFNPETL